MRLFVPILLVAASIGCYGYYPTRSFTPGPGMQIAAELSDSGSAALTRYVGPGVVAVEGTVMRTSDSAIALSVRTVRQFSGNESGWRGEEVTLSRGLIARVSERRFSPARTMLFAGAMVVGAIALRNTFAGAGLGSPPTEGTSGRGPR